MRVNGKHLTKGQLNQIIKNYIRYLAVELFISKVDYLELQKYFDEEFKKRALMLSKGNISEAARILNVKRSTLSESLKRIRESEVKTEIVASPHTIDIPESKERS